MSQNKFFRASFSYFGLDEQTGKLTKEKKEVLLSAVNYTDAECLVSAILPDLQTHSDDVDYEIKRINKNLLMVLSPAISVSDTLTKGLFNYYIEGSEDQVSLFKVTVEIEEPRDKGKSKKTREDWWVPAENSKQAYDIIQVLLSKIEIRDYTVKNITFDAADEVFVTEQEHKKLLYQSESASIL